MFYFLHTNNCLAPFSQIILWLFFLHILQFYFHIIQLLFTFFKSLLISLSLQFKMLDITISLKMYHDLIYHNVSIKSSYSPALNNKRDLNIFCTKILQLLLMHTWCIQWKKERQQQGIWEGIAFVHCVSPTPLARPQHLSGLELLRDMCDGNLEGATVGSSEILLTSSKIKCGNYIADTHTAG